jgi:hypothetical protein
VQFSLKSRVKSKTEKMKKLIYFHVNGADFVTMYDLCIESCKEDLARNKITVLCITNDEFKDKIEAVNTKWQVLDAKIMVVEYKSDMWMHKYLGKFDILEWPELKEYEQILFSDVDILYFPFAMENIFKVIKKSEVLYAVPENLEFTQPWFWHPGVYTEEETNKIKQSPIRRPLNGGMLAWQNDPNQYKILGQLQQIRDHVYEKGGQLTTDAWEQPYINHRFLVDQNLSYDLEQVVTLRPENIMFYMQRSQRVAPVAMHFTHSDKIQRMRPIAEVIRSVKQTVYGK